MHSPVEVGFPVEWNNTLTLGWALIQTSDNLGEQPWHAHIPATLSGCYYVWTCGREDQGNVEFMNPAAENYSQPAQGQLTPKAGNMIIFLLFFATGPAPVRTRLKPASHVASILTGYRRLLKRQKLNSNIGMRHFVMRSCSMLVLRQMSIGAMVVCGQPQAIHFARTRRCRSPSLSIFRRPINSQWLE
jgi:hypothetical protein